VQHYESEVAPRAAVALCDPSRRELISHHRGPAARQGTI